MATESSEVPKCAFRALVVDDSQIARYLLSGRLADLGFTVKVSDSAEAAISTLSGPTPDIIFMDHLLPGMNGLEAVRHLRGQTNTAQTPIVMYTSQDGEEFAAMARAAGANDVYTKTSERGRLEKILQALALLPRAPAAQRNSDNVVPMTHKKAPPARKLPRRPLTRGELTRLLEPSLEVHHSRLRQELLAEFAILERYEERMRRDLFARVDSQTQQTYDEVQQVFAEQRTIHAKEARRNQVRSWGVAATLLLGVALGSAAIWNIAQRAGQLQQSDATIQATLAVQTQALDSLRSSVVQVRDAAMTQGGNTDVTNWPPVPNPARPQGQGGPAALVNELQSMGILGPVRIETHAGSFCVRATPTGFTIESASVALADCEPLPVQVSQDVP